jgi:nucleotide-binding universal stress UspA family protein
MVSPAGVPSGMYEHILVPTDGSEAARRAVSEAIDLARQFDATVHALYVVDRSALAFAGGDDESYEFDDARLLEVLEEEGERATAMVADLAADVDVRVETSVERGAPAERILDYVDDNDVDLVVMGTHGRRGLDRFLFGSTAEAVSRRTTVPVMTIRTKREA